MTDGAVGSPPPVRDLVGHADAALFDLDGVITDTASLHMVAWGDMFRAFLAGRPGVSGDLAPYTDDDYFRHVDGKPRLDGIRAVLASRGIDLPEGEADDPAEADTVHGLARRKNDAFLRALDEGVVAVYPGTIRLVQWLLDRSVPCAVVSSSRNARRVLEAVDLLDAFAHVVDGTTAQEEGLRGKPAPDTFVAAARRLGARAAHTVAFEDAESGVRAAADGGLRVVAVDRGAGHAALADAGAELVVDDLAELITVDASGAAAPGGP